jgi:hypothetical protein
LPTVKSQCPFVEVQHLRQCEKLRVHYCASLRRVSSYFEKTSFEACAKRWRRELASCAAPGFAFTGLAPWLAG